ncbi:MAG: restriction endonuclease subunit S [bacterium]|nr:restriction endonuclease subunit S [bacterium]
MPKGWARSRLGELGRYLNGRGFKKSEWATTGRPIIRIQDLTGTTASPNYFDGDVEERHIARDGDFLISWAATLGAYIYRGPEGLVNQHIFKVETFINQAFHFYAVTHAIEDMYRRTRGTGMVHIVKAEFDNTEIPLPPLAEQARIADRIDELFTDLAAGVAALERVKRNLSRYRAAVLHAAVTGRLTEAWRKKHSAPEEPAPKLLERILVERRKQWERRTLAAFEAKGKQPPKNWKSRYKEPAPPKLPEDGTTLPELPEGWCWASVDQAAEVQGGLQKSPSRAPVENHYPYLRVANVKRGRLDLEELHRFELTDAELDKLRLEDRDLLIVEGNGSVTEIGRSAIWRNEVADCVHQNHIIRVRLAGGIIPDYMDTFVNSPLGQQYMRKVASSTSGLHTLSVGKVRSIDFPLPPEIEQAAIVEAVSEKLSQIDALEAEVTRGLARAGRLRQAILKSAFEGRLVPQDPNDEPASVLLERIREQAAKAPKPKRQTRKKTTRKAATR